MERTNSREDVTVKGEFRPSSQRRYVSRVHQGSCRFAFRRCFLRAGHEGHCVGHCVVLRIDDAQASAEPVEMNAICDLEHMGHVMADQNDRDTP